MKVKNRRFLTKGVEERIPLRLQIFLWSCIDALPSVRDYLQVFTFTADSGGLKIIHTQEEPSYEQVYLLPEDAPAFLGKIFVIDDGEHYTMMRAAMSTRRFVKDAMITTIPLTKSAIR